MIFGVLNPEKIGHQQLIHVPTSPVYCSHFTLGNPKKSFSTVLFIHTSDYLRYLRRKQTVTPLPTTCPPHLKNVAALPCKMQNFFVWLKVMLCSSRHWWLWKELVVMWGNWNARQATSQQVFKVTTFCTDKCFQSFPHRSTAPCLVKFCPCRNKTLPQLVTIADWYSTHAIFQHAADAAIYRIEVRTVDWPHVRTDELRCLTAQKLDSVDHEHDVLTHCLAAGQTCLQQCYGSLVAPSASSARLGNTARWYLLQAQWRWAWYSRVWIP